MITMTRIMVVRSFAIAIILLGYFSLAQQLMIRKRAPVLEIEDLNLLSTVDEMRRLGSGGEGEGGSKRKEEKYFTKNHYKSKGYGFKSDKGDKSHGYKGDKAWKDHSLIKVDKAWKGYSFQDDKSDKSYRFKDDKSDKSYGFKGDKKGGSRKSSKLKSEKKEVNYRKGKKREKGSWEEEYDMMGMMFSSMSMPSEPSPDTRPTNEPTMNPPRSITPTGRPTEKSTTSKPSGNPTLNPATSTTGSPTEEITTSKPTSNPTSEAVTTSTAEPVTPAPISKRTLSPTLILSSRSDVMKKNLEEVTESSILEDPTTPQGMAYKWIVETDPAQIDPCSYATVEQRYALATFYYSTNGDDWTNSNAWLSGTNECSWVGIKCDADGLVDEIGVGGELSKFHL